MKKFRPKKSLSTCLRLAACYRQNQNDTKRNEFDSSLFMDIDSSIAEKINDFTLIITSLENDDDVGENGSELER